MKQQPTLEELMKKALPVLTVRQPWANQLVSGVKKFEYRDWRLPKRLLDMWVIIHAAKTLDRQYVHESKQSFLDYTDLKNEKRNFSSFVGAVIFGEPERRDTILGYKYRWPVLDFLKFDEPITGIKGKLGIWYATPEMMKGGKQ